MSETTEADPPNRDNKTDNQASNDPIMDDSNVQKDPSFEDQDNTLHKETLVFTLSELAAENEQWVEKYIHSSMYYLAVGSFGAVFQITTRLWSAGKLGGGKEVFLHHDAIRESISRHHGCDIDKSHLVEEANRSESLTDLVGMKLEMLESEFLRMNQSKLHLFLRRDYETLDNLWEESCFKVERMVGFPAVFDFGYLGNPSMYGIDEKYLLKCVYLDEYGQPTNYKKPSYRSKKFGTPTKIAYMTVELVGPSMEDFRNYWQPLYDPKHVRPVFDVETAFIIADQLLCRLMVLHSSGYVHHDIKPDNVAIGTGRAGNTVYLLDFGFAKKVSPGGLRPAFRMGSSKFISIDAARMRPVNFSQDLESWFYLLLSLLYDSFPWDKAAILSKGTSPLDDRNMNLVIRAKRNFWPHDERFDVKWKGDRWEEDDIDRRDGNYMDENKGGESFSANSSNWEAEDMTEAEDSHTYSDETEESHGESPDESSEESPEESSEMHEENEPQAEMQATETNIEEIHNADNKEKEASYEERDDLTEGSNSTNASSEYSESSAQDAAKPSRQQKRRKFYPVNMPKEKVQKLLQENRAFLKTDRKTGAKVVYVLKPKEDTKVVEVTEEKKKPKKPKKKARKVPRKMKQAPKDSRFEDERTNADDGRIEIGDLSKEFDIMMANIESLHRARVPDIHHILRTLHREVSSLRYVLRRLGARNQVRKINDHKSIVFRKYMSIRKVLLHIFLLPDIFKNPNFADRPRVLVGARRATHSEVIFKELQMQRKDLHFFNYKKNDCNWHWDRFHAELKSQVAEVTDYGAGQFNISNRSFADLPPAARRQLLAASNSPLSPDEISCLHDTECGVLVPKLRLPPQTIVPKP